MSETEAPAMQAARRLSRSTAQGQIYRCGSGGGQKFTQPVQLSKEAVPVQVPCRSSCPASTYRQYPAKIPMAGAPRTRRERMASYISPRSGQDANDQPSGQLGLVQNDNACPVGSEADIFGKISHEIPPSFEAGPGCGNAPTDPGWPPPAAPSGERPPPARQCCNKFLLCAPAAPCGQRHSTGRCPR